MPCVLPVLSLKAMQLLSVPKGRDAGRIAALAYAAGVLVTFLTLGALMLALRQAGLAAGWGFQLQSPPFVAAMALLIAVLALWMSDGLVLNVATPVRMTQLMVGQGYGADFWSGALLAVLASPCIGPFMGPALAYGLAVGGGAAMAVFAALALGLASPFVLLAWVPAFGRMLPKPGAWMSILKQLLALPMLLTAVWLVYVLAGQVSPPVLALFLGALVTTIFLLWFNGRVLSTRPVLVGRLTLGLAAGVMAGALLLVGQPSQLAAHQAWQGMEYSSRDLAQLRAEQRRVLLAVTARWCATCIANEQLVLGTRQGADLMLQNNVVLMRADYTETDPAVAALLREHSAAGVPLYVYYREDGVAVQLPQILSLSALHHALTGP